MATLLPGRAEIRETGFQREGDESRLEQRTGKLVEHGPAIDQPE